MKQSAKQLAAQSGLRYVNDQIPGFTRKKWCRGFTYLDLDGQHIDNQELRDRFEQLAIPPSRQNVWICPDENGHLQATGRDAKGRKQYRYHPEWEKIRNQAKFDRLVPFGRALSRIRQQTNSHLEVDGLPREKVLALVVKLLEMTLIRVGNVAYAQANQSYGLTTLRSRHITIEGHQVDFEFTGKSGVEHQVALTDQRLANIIKRCYEIPGYRVFQYLDDDGNHQKVDSEDVNDYLRLITQADFTAKDFRTWAGTILTAQRLAEQETHIDTSLRKQQVKAAIEIAARQLGNRPATCRKYYVHPKVPEAYLTGELVTIMQSTYSNIIYLDDYEFAVLKLLEI
ncbi:MAG: DNA topoisomerase IB [Leptolyngbyaceae cyanobacterium]